MDKDFKRGDYVKAHKGNYGFSQYGKPTFGKVKSVHPFIIFLEGISAPFSLEWTEASTEEEAMLWIMKN